jgi:hypothetical protein
MPKTIFHALCLCGHSYDHHGDDGECTICKPEDKTCNGYREFNGRIRVITSFLTEADYALICAAVRKSVLVDEVYLEG